MDPNLVDQTFGELFLKYHFLCTDPENGKLHKRVGVSEHPCLLRVVVLVLTGGPARELLTEQRGCDGDGHAAPGLRRGQKSRNP